MDPAVGSAVAGGGRVDRPMNGAPLDVHVTGTVYVDMVFAMLPGPPLPGREMRTASVGTSPGGVANLAVALRRLGLSVRLDAAFATDTYADYLWRTLDAEGVDLGASVRLVDWATPLTVSLAYASDRFMVTCERPHPASIPTNVETSPPRARCAFIGLREPTPRWLERAQAAGTIVFADVGWDETERWPAEDLAALERVDAFLPNLDEAMAYTRTSSAEDAARRLVELVPLVVVKCGAGGAIALRSGDPGPVHEPAIDVEAIDPTGAGDVFDAAFMFGMLAGWTLQEVLRFGNLCAGLSVRHHGGSLSAPSWGEVAEWVLMSPERAGRHGFLHRYLAGATERVPPQRAHPTL
jgi:sugar/nucleoside kinase (ribokinase family)